MLDANLSTFYGRFVYFCGITDPRCLIYSDDEVLKAKKSLEAHKISPKSSTLDEATAQHYQRLTDAAIHPVTGQVIPRIFRVSAIAPVNIPIVSLMLACPPTNVLGTLSLHWINQSYNTACNYANRSGSDQVWKDTAVAYTLAVSSACGFAYGLGRLVSRGPPRLQRLGILIPCVSTIVASTSNLAFTRSDEFLRGSLVRDESGQPHGLSKVAGMWGVAQTALGRCVLVPCACLLLPPAFMAAFRFMKILPRSRLGLVAVELSVIYASLQGAMPAALAVFPPTMSFDVMDLEEEFRHLRDSQGRPVARLYAHKGL